MTELAKRVLLVEDSTADVRLVRELLSPEDEFDLDVAASFADAVTHLTVRHYDAVLLDLGLPDGQGLELVERTLRAAPDTAIVVLTGRADEELAQQALRAGAQDYFLKINMSAEGLPRAVRYAMLRRELEAELGLPLQLTQRLRVLGRATEAVLAAMASCHDDLQARLDDERRRCGPEDAHRYDTMLNLVRRLRTLTQELGLGSEAAAP